MTSLGLGTQRDKYGTLLKQVGSEATLRVHPNSTQSWERDFPTLSSSFFLRKMGIIDWS